jgi:imidazole glycerol-phosphate synthase subunit HisH
MTVLVIDYGMGNLGSVKRALEECGANVLISDDPQDIPKAERMILPGVGAFPDGMANLRQRGWIEGIKAAVFEREVPLLGVCLGMQLLVEIGHEGEETSGLGLIPGSVQRLHPDRPSARIPHVGWNEVHVTQDNPLFKGIATGSDFYFVHSYHVAVQQAKNAIATTPYCGGFVSALMATPRIFGAQFHPEKSSKPGFQLLRNFLAC